MRNSISLILIIFGALALVLGLVLRASANLTRAFAWFGNLPGDIRYSSGNVRVFIPITSMIIVSIILSVIVWLARRWL